MFSLFCVDIIDCDDNNQKYGVIRHVISNNKNKIKNSHNYNHCLIRTYKRLFSKIHYKIDKKIVISP